MASHRQDRSRRTNRRLISAGMTTGAFLAAGLAPISLAPAAHADLWDLFVDPIGDVLVGGQATDAFGDFADLGVALGSADAGPLDFWQSINDSVQDWLASASGMQLAEMINQPFVYLFGRDLIGNGLDDFTDANTSLLGSTGMFGDLGDGGFLFGNGGAVAAGEAGVNDGVGWAGGSAGLFGDGGDGGTGGSTGGITGGAGEPGESNVDGTGGAGGDGGAPGARP